jgi:hypothetical protein
MTPVDPPLALAACGITDPHTSSQTGGRMFYRMYTVVEVELERPQFAVVVYK